ncbi:MAG: glycosyltransferase family 9 protein [Planctomycetota bacterium]
MQAVNSTLVVRLSALGDVLFALPAVQALARSGCAGRITWLVEDRAAALLEGQEEFFDLLIFPRRRWLAWPGWVVRQLTRRTDLVIDLQGSLKSRVHVSLARSPKKLGFDASLARNGAQRALTQQVAPPPWARHRIVQALVLTAAAGAPVSRHPNRPILPIRADARDRAAALIRDIAGAGPLVVLHPGTSAFGALKRWDALNFGRLGVELQRRVQARILVTGSPPEAALVNEVLEQLAGGPTRAAPTRNLQELAAILGAADLVVAADSLPLHYANALGTPVVGLYGPKDSAVTGPFFDRARVVRAGVACSPCTLRRCTDRICMARLEVADAVSAALDLLQSGRS